MKTTAYILLGTALGFGLLVSAVLGFATGYEGWARTCGEARDYLNSLVFAYSLMVAFAALIVGTAILIATTRRR